MGVWKGSLKGNYIKMAILDLSPPLVPDLSPLVGTRTRFRRTSGPLRTPDRSPRLGRVGCIYVLTEELGFLLRLSFDRRGRTEPEFAPVLFSTVSGV